MSILSIPQVFEPLGPMRSKRRNFSCQTPLLHYPPPITGFKYLFQYFDSVMARRRIYREHQVSESLHSFFAVKFMVHTSLKKILEVPNGTLDTRKKITTKICRSISDFSAHLYGARDIKRLTFADPDDKNCKDAIGHAVSADGFPVPASASTTSSG